MDGIGVLLVVAAVVWLAVVFVRGGIVGGCLATLAAGCCLGYPLFHLPTRPIPLSLDRVLWVVLLVQYLVWRRFGWTDP